MDQHYLTPLFEPRAIALFTGAQDAPEQQTPQARALLAHLQAQAFKGEVLPLSVHTTGTLADLAQARADVARWLPQYLPGLPRCARQAGQVLR